jgi:hypothetical protein
VHQPAAEQPRYCASIGPLFFGDSAGGDACGAACMVTGTTSIKHPVVQLASNFEVFFNSSNMSQRYISFRFWRANGYLP